MLHIAICDDEPEMAAEIHKLMLQNNHIYDNSVIREGGIHIDEYSSGKILLEAMEDGRFYQLIFLDIEMPDMDGISLARAIRAQDEMVLLIYVSAHEKYLIDLFEVSPFRFIRKPIEEDIFSGILMEALKRILKTQSYFIYESGWTECRVLMQDILFFESNGRRIDIVTDTKRETFYGKMDDVEARLISMSQCFFRIHQSYLVNPDSILKIGTWKAEVVGGITLPISKNRQKAVREQYLSMIQRGS